MLDTRSKRASSIGIGLLFILAPPLPDTTLNQGDRQHVAVSYAGILASAAEDQPVLRLCNPFAVNLNPARRVRSINPVFTVEEVCDEV